MIATTTAAHPPAWHDDRADICEARAEKAAPGGQFQNYLTKCVEYHRQQAAIGRNEIEAYVEEWIARDPIAEAGL